MYQMIAFDMDGTLLNSKKQISADSVTAMQKAVSAKKQIIVATGRALAQLKEYRSSLKNVQFAILANGALIYDLANDKILAKKSLSVQAVERILKITAGKNIMLVGMLDGQVYLQQSHYQRLEDYHMGIYKNLYRMAATFVDDIREVLWEHSSSLEKIELFHLNAAERDVSFDMLQSHDTVTVKSEKSGIEITALKAEKGEGLQFLCDYLNEPISAAIAVGDSANDADILKQAGLGIAMGNASQSIKDLADAIVSDNDHSGCAEAIYHHLLQQKSY